MADDLVLAHDEVDVGLGLHVQRNGAEDRRVQPGKGLAGADVVAEDVVGGGGPAQRGEGAPLRAFPFGELRDVLAGEANRRLTIGLRAELRVMGGGPVGHLLQIVLVDQFGQRLAVVVADGVGLGRSSGDQLGQVGNQVVAAALLELLGQLRGPVGRRRPPASRRRWRRAGSSPKALISGSPTFSMCLATASWENESST